MTAPAVRSPLPRLRSGARTLRGRLLLTTVTLFALSLAVIALVTTLLLRTYLISQVDDQLRGSLDRITSGPGRPGGNDGDGDVVPGGPYQAPESLLGLYLDDELRAAVVDQSGQQQPVSVKDADELVGLKPGEPETVYLVGYGSYRVEARAVGDERVIVGLPLDRTDSAVRRLILVSVVVAASALVLSTVAGSLLIGRALRPLRRLAGTAARISKLPLSKGEVGSLERVEQRDADERTEVGQVGSAFNQMLGHVERALESRQASETRVRTFVADASHELRTPLAAIRGYAELTRRSRQEVPEDIAHALSRVESESARMTVLVEDLLLLARLDSGRPLSRDPVDLSDLLVDALSDAHATSADHTWNLDLPDEQITVPGDRARLHQVVANLLANARTHTPAGTVVDVTLRPSDDGSSAIITVADDGPGIPPSLLPSVFERFARGDSSRARRTGSTGLGLAIVSAVCSAHGGTVEVDSSPAGTTFTVTLPR